MCVCVCTYLGKIKSQPLGAQTHKHAFKLWNEQANRTKELMCRDKVMPG